MDDATILVSGYGRLPEGVASQNLYGTVGVILIVDTVTGTITDVDSTLLTGAARQFFRELCIGSSIAEMPKLRVRVERRYFGNSQRALLVALRRAGEQYERIMGEARLPPPASSPEG